MPQLLEKRNVWVAAARPPLPLYDTISIRIVGYSMPLPLMAQFRGEMNSRIDNNSRTKKIQTH
jgi:hypothetical protein